MRQLWIADRCREFGLKVTEVDGWRTRGNETFAPRGVVAHHTANGPGEIGSLRVLINGRSDLPGPLCNVGLGRSGTVYVIASGRANHAGTGGWKGLSGNSSVLGIEAENRGGAGDPWPQVQLAAYKRLCAALITGPGVGGAVALVCGHKEWAPNRKVDPHSIDMDGFRRDVKAIVDGQEDEMTPQDWERLEDLVDGKLREYVGAPYTTASGKSLTTNTMLTEHDGKGYVDGVKFLRGLLERIAAKVGA
jgi:hypothetical protein